MKYPLSGHGSLCIECNKRQTERHHQICDVCWSRAYPDGSICSDPECSAAGRHSLNPDTTEDA